MKKAGLWVVALLFVLFIWPTPYRYDQVGNRLVKTNRILGALGLDKESYWGDWGLLLRPALPLGVYAAFGFGVGVLAAYLIARRRMQTRSPIPILVIGLTLALAGGLAIVTRYRVTFGEGWYYLRLDRWTGDVELIRAPQLNRTPAAIVEDLGPATGARPTPPPGTTWDTPIPAARSYTEVGPAPAAPKPPPGFVLDVTPKAPRGQFADILDATPTPGKKRPAPRGAGHVNH